jgi:hypothetical protein
MSTLPMCGDQPCRGRTYAANVDRDPVRLILCVAARAAPPASEPPAAAGSATLFEGARLITGDEAQPIEDSAFVVQDGTFTAVGRRGNVQAPEGRLGSI